METDPRTALENPSTVTRWRWTRKATIVAAVGSSAFAAIYAAQTVALQNTESRPIDAFPIVVVSFAQWWMWGLLAPVVITAANHWPIARAPRAATAARHTLLALLLSLTHAAVIAMLVMYMPFSERPRGFLDVFSSYAYSRLQGNVLIYVALLSVHWGLIQAAIARERAVQTVALEGALARAELDALRMQLNPHFLFNTLHAIRTLVDSDQTKARHMLLRLGDLLHATLDASAQQESSLEEELTLLRGYLDIESTRFADRLTVVIDVPSTLSTARVPSFVLQPLAENAVRHGISQRVIGGRIELVARDDAGTLAITMTNDAPTTPGRSTRGHGVGLATTRARLARLYGNLASIDLTLRDEHAVLQLRLPLRRA